MRCTLAIVLAALALGACQADRSAAKPTGSAPSVDGAWRQAFGVDKAALSPTGRSRFVDLTPGTRHIYREGKTTLTITVLDETRVVDGVTTRVIEEREERNGQPLEISRNYFAIDQSSGDVYYFGEEVDVFENGKLSGHPGGWLSGVNGATFGLALPGAPRVGDRYYQEVSPGVAMDRGEVVGVDDTVETPFGAFKGCVHVRETTPLESDVGDKWYAPGVGLVKDDEAVLVSREPPTAMKTPAPRK
ncbi:MAG: hypothetical protein WC718_06290 [Phycisphaerales bacterium]